jgi:hypothetical protein
MFPMFNQIFRSPEFSTESAGNDYRFVPESVGAALWRPFAMIDPRTLVHEELSAPDPRYAILVALVVMFIARWGLRRLRRTPAPPIDPKSKDSTRVLAALGFGLGLNWVLWIHVSGNGRYVLTMACVAAAVIVGMLFRLFESHPKVRNYILAIIFVTQGIQLYFGTQFRWNGAPWGGQWFQISVPEKLKTEPNLYLTLGTQSNSFIAPFLSKDSGFVNLGGYTLDLERANGARVRALIRRFSPNVRVVFRRAWPYESAEGRVPILEVDEALVEFGLRPDMRDCATITVHGLTPDLAIRYETSLPQQPQSRDTTYLITCRMVPDTVDRSDLFARQRAVNLVFDRLEDACPKLFQPRRLATSHYGVDLWRRGYGSSDIVVWISYGRVKFRDLIRPHGIIDIGSESDWAKAPLRLDCGKRNGAYFANVLPKSP